MLTNEQIEQIDKMSTEACRLFARDAEDIDILEYLSNHEEYGVRCHVAINKHTPKCTLSKLSKDYDDNVRANVADNVHTPTDTLSELSKDAHSGIRYYVAENVNTPKHILKKLSNDENEDVCIEANEQLEKYNINIDKHTTKGILE